MIDEVIRGSGYKLDTGSGVFTMGLEASIQYSDGHELETKLLGDLRGISDLSTLSVELIEKCTDWFHSYHLSPARSNLLRPFRERLGGTVLELGAGCGAITRYLGECAASVVAVEGTWQRSLICSERTRDQPNVQVVHSEITKFDIPLQFDAVVIVGVLEYSALFVESPSPHLKFLQMAKKHLKPNGTLFLAIENKLGLKYFAGSPEDHAGIPMYGVEDKYEQNGVRTFSKQEITRLFQSAGFCGLRFHYPLPDYQLTRAVVSQEGIDSCNFDSAWLAAQLVNSDPQIPLNTNFELRGTWKTVGEAGLEDELANSFLIEASITAEEKPTRRHGVMAHWYSSLRTPSLMFEKEFAKSPKGDEIKVKITPFLSSTVSNSEYSWAYSSPRVMDEKYFEGVPYALHFTKVLLDENLKPKILLDEVLKFIELARNFASDNGYLWPKQLKDSVKIDGRLIDALPRNAILLNQSDLQFYDLEWVSSQQIELGYYMFRLTGDLYEIYSQAPPANGLAFLESRESLVEEIWRALDFSLERVGEWQGLERAFVAYVRGSIPEQLQRTFLTSQGKESDLVKALHGSLSWRLTKPLRWFGGKVSAIRGKTPPNKTNRM